MMKPKIKFLIATIALGQLAMAAAHAPLLDFDVLKNPTQEDLIRFDDGPSSPNTRLSRIQTDNLYYGHDLALDTSGNMYAVAGGVSSPNTTRPRFVVSRYTHYYALDAGFGTAGSVATTLGPHAMAFGGAPGADNTFYAVGRSLQSNNWQSTVVRYLSNGSLDTAFAQTAIAYFDFGGADFSRAARADSQGRIVVAGYTVRDGVSKGILYRMTSNGGLDTTFATQGYAFYTLSGQSSLFLRLNRNESKWLVSGASGSGNQAQMTAWRILSNGNLDTAFFTTGMRTVTPGYQSLGYDTQVAPTGEIYLTGSFVRQSPPLYRQVAIARMLSDGAFDSSFGTTGVSIQTLTSAEFPWYVPAVLETTGQLFFAASSRVQRLNSNGTRSATPSITRGTGDDPQAVALDSQGDEWIIQNSGRVYPSGTAYLVPYVYFNTYYSLGYAAPGNMGYVRANSQGKTMSMLLVSVGTTSSIVQGSPAIGSPFSFSGGFPGTGGTCGTGPLANSESCQLVIDFQTSPKGVYQDTISVNYSDGTKTKTLAIPLSMTASDLGVSDFPSYAYDTAGGICVPTSASFTVTNYGSSTITGLSLTQPYQMYNYGDSFTNYDVYFSVSYNSCSSSLAPSASCTFALDITIPTASMGFSYRDYARFDLKGGSEGTSTEVSVEHSSTFCR